jgi:hypothetical protein
LLCKLFGFLICGIGNVGDIRHLVQCFLAQWCMKSCFWWVLCSNCKHLNSFGLGFAGCWWCRWRLIWVPKLWYFTLLSFTGKAKSLLVWDENELQTFCNMFRNLEVIHRGLLNSFTKVSTLPTEVYVFRGRENCWICSSIPPAGLQHRMWICFQSHCRPLYKCSCPVFFLVDREIHVIMSSILTLDGFNNFTQKHMVSCKSLFLLHIWVSSYFSIVYFIAAYYI